MSYSFSTCRLQLYIHKAMSTISSRKSYAALLTHAFTRLFHTLRHGILPALRLLCIFCLTHFNFFVEKFAPDIKTLDTGNWGRFVANSINVEPDLKCRQFICTGAQHHTASDWRAAELPLGPSSPKTNIGKKFAKPLQFGCRARGFVVVQLNR